MQSCILLLLGVCLAFAAAGPFYRKDYTYFEEFDAFYKLHVRSNISWSSAFYNCEHEGATLFYPQTTEELRVVTQLATERKSSATEVFIGIHDEFGIGEFMTVDGKPSPTSIAVKNNTPGVGSNCISLNVDKKDHFAGSCTGLYFTPKSFVCKKVESRPCPTIDRAYKYDEYAKKCYKVNERATNWQYAMQTCFMEGGILAVQENDAQVTAIHRVLKPGSDKYFVGVRKMFGADYYTVKGQLFDSITKETDENNNGQIHDENVPYPDEPRRFYVVSRAIRNCGVITHSTGKLYAVDCEKALPFICEMEVTQ